MENQSNSHKHVSIASELTSHSRGQRLCIYIGESDRWRGKPLDTAVLETLRSRGLAGATVFRGTSGFGAHSHIRTTSIEVLSVDLPILIEAVDTPERIQQALEAVSPMVSEGLITLEDVTICKYAHRYMNPLPADRLVSEVMTGEVISLSETQPIRDAWEKMLHNELKALPVVNEQGIVTGILTDEDMLERAGIKQRLSLTLHLEDSSIQDELKTLGKSEVRVKDVMTSPVIMVHLGDSLGQAVNKMVKSGLKRMPVVDTSGRLTGMISRLDILRQVADSPAHKLPVPLPPGSVKLVRDIMRGDIPTVHMDEILPSIVEKFAGYDTHRLIVVDGKGLAVGLISDSDVVTRVQSENRHGILDALRRIGKPPAGKETAAELMSPGVTVIQPEASIAEAARVMLKEGRKWLVVVSNNDQPVGLIDRRVLMEALGSGL